MDVAVLLATLMGGGLIQFGIQLLLNKGTVQLRHRHISLNYISFQLQNTISHFVVTLQYTNTSAYNVIVDGLKFKFWSGERLIECEVEGHLIFPAFVVAGKNVSEVKYKLLLDDVMDLPILSFDDDTAYVEISFNIKKKTRVVKVKSSEIALLEEKQWTAF